MKSAKIEPYTRNLIYEYRFTQMTSEVTTQDVKMKYWVIL